MVIPAMDKWVDAYIYLYAPTADSFAAKTCENGNSGNKGNN
ncbi:MAG: hypothetical protein V7L29_09650 [Nostoc sp.]